MVDPESDDIFYLDEISRGIWRVLSDRGSLEDLVEISEAAFPETPKEQIKTDLRKALEHLSYADAILVETSGPQSSLTVISTAHVRSLRLVIMVASQIWSGSQVPPHRCRHIAGDRSARVWRPKITQAPGHCQAIHRAPRKIRMPPSRD